MAETGTIAFPNLYNKIPAICALLAVCIGLAGLSGWIFNIDFLKTFLSDGATMKVNTALLVIISGISLLLQVRSKRIPARIAAAMIILISIAILLEYLLGINLHIDEVFVRDLATDPLKEPPGRTSFLTAVSALILGIALWAVSSKHFRFGQLVGSILFTVVYISLIGHLFHISGFYQFGRYSGVAFHTSLGLIAVSIGLLIMGREKGWIGFLYGRLNNLRSRIFFLIYILGAAPLMAAIYLFVIKQSVLSPASDVVILILVTLILILPVAYFLLKTVGTLGQELLETDTRLQIALDAARLGVWHINPDTNALEYNSILADIFGYESDSPMTYDQAIAQVSEGYREEILHEIGMAMKMRSDYDITYQQRRFNDGELIWLRSFGKVSAHEEGRSPVFSGLVMDITDKVKQQEQLQQLNEEMAATVEELRTTNEELVESGNDRQKLLEEFEALNEELRSSNDEQLSINQQLAQMNDRYRQAQDELLLAVNAAALATFDFNPSTGKFAGNDLLKAWFGLQPGEDIELAIATERIVPPDREKVNHAITEALTYGSGGKYEVEYTITGAAGNDPRIVRAKGQALFNGEQAIRLSGVLLDITEQKKDEQRKNDFIGMVSHELKTPLTSLTALVQMTSLKLKNSEDTFLREAMAKANVQVKRMSGMINGFLNVTRLESGKMHIDKTKFNIDALAREIVEEVRVTANDHRYNFENCDPVEVTADRDKIGSVIHNLLSNAIKYSPKDSLIIITCQAKTNTVEIAIKDEGAGIKEADRFKVFERFYRVQTDSHYMVAGFGIGLYLSAEIVERHGGNIWVESLEDNGSTFYFSLPLR